MTSPEPTRSDMRCRNTKLFCRGKSKGNVVAASVQPIVFRRARCHQYLKGRRPVQVSIVCRVRRKKIMPPKVHHDKAVAADKSAPVGPRSQLVPTDIECRFGDEVRLILFLYLAGVTRSINQRNEHHALVFKTNAARVWMHQKERRGLPLKFHLAAKGTMRILNRRSTPCSSLSASPGRPWALP